MHKKCGKSQQFVRIGIQRGFLPFGIAEKVSGNKYTYYISAEKFYKYIGKELPAKYQDVKGNADFGVITDLSLARKINWRY